MNAMVLRSMILVAPMLVACATESSLPAGIARDSGVVADAAPRDTIRVAAFNVRRLFDERCDSGMCGPTDFEATATTAQIDARTRTIAERLATLDADAICLEEVETQALLDKVAGALPTHVLGETGGTASLDVGLISRLPLITTKRHRDRVLTRPDGSTTTFARELLEVHLDARGKKLIVFCAHYRSKSSDDPGRRLAEARATREIMIEAARESALVVLGGDLNDTPGSPPLLALEEGGQLLRTSSGLTDEQIATYWFEGRGAAIDHLYMVRSAAHQARGFTVARDTDGRTFAGSDHAAVHVELTGF